MKNLQIIEQNESNILFKTNDRYYIVENGKELVEENAWCDCRTLAQAKREFKNY